MPYIKHGKSYVHGPAVMYSHRGKETPTAATLDIENFPLNSRGEAHLPAGSFIVDATKSDGKEYSRILPQAIIKEAIEISSKDITFIRNIESYPFVPFLPGDVLYMAKPIGTFTCIAAGKGSLSLMGITAEFTPPGTDTTVFQRAISYAKYFNKSFSALKNRIEFIVSGSSLIAVAVDGISEFVITPDGTNLRNSNMVGDADDPVTTTKNITPIGTVARVLPDEDKLELVANAAIAVPAGLTVGATYGFIRGMLETSIELRAEFPSDNQGLVTGGSVYQLRIPYWDAEILRQLPKLTVREKF